MNNSKIEVIDRFLADNQELEELSARLSQFNVFRSLKIENIEIRHSNVLAWLLDPQESHGLSDIVLRKVLSNILLLSENPTPGISAAKVELMDFSDIEVLREWKNIDILVVDHSNKLVLFFENKIYSGESERQLIKYLEIVKKEFPSYVIIPVFLTLTGIESTDDLAKTKYIPYSHLQLSIILEKLYAQRKSQLAEPVQMFLRHYLDTLRKLTMQDEELMDLCKTIYRKHREAVDLIIEYGKVSAFSQAAQDVINEDGKYEVLYSAPSHFWFIPKTWIPWIPENAEVWQYLKRPVSVCCWFEYYSKKLYSHFEVCKMDDPELRMECVNGLKDAGFKLSQKAFDKNASYSRFYGKSVKINDETDYDEMRAAIEKLLHQAQPEFPQAEKVFQKVFKKIKS